MLVIRQRSFIIYYNKLKLFSYQAPALRLLAIDIPGFFSYDDLAESESIPMPLRPTRLTGPLPAAKHCLKGRTPTLEGGGLHCAECLMKRLASGIFCWVLLVMSVPALVDAAQEQQSPAGLSLSEAVQTAVRENATMSAARSRVKASEERITQARSGLFPQVYFSESYNRTTNPMWAFGTNLNQEIIKTSDFDPVKLNDPDAIDNFASTLSVSWSLFDGGQTWFGWRQAKLGSTAAVHMMDRTRQQVIVRAVRAYVGLLLAQEQLSVMRQALDTAREHLKMVRSRFESGFVVKSDLLRTQVHIAQLEQQHLVSESQVAIARAELNAAMGVPVDSLYELTSPLEAGDAIAEPVDHWIDTALSRRADYKQLQYQQDIAREEISKARAAHLPSVNLVGNYEMNTEDFSDRGENYTLGALVSINLFSGQRLSAKTREARAVLLEVNAVQREMEQGIRVETKAAFLQTESAWKRIQVARSAVDQAEEALRIVCNRYNSGLLTIIELLDAELALQQTRTSHFKAIGDYKVAVVGLYLAAGTLDENFH